MSLKSSNNDEAVDTGARDAALASGYNGKHVTSLSSLWPLLNDSIIRRIQSLPVTGIFLYSTFPVIAFYTTFPILDISNDSH